MTKRKLFSIFGIVIMIIHIVNMFIPFVSNGTDSYNMFEYFDNVPGKLQISIILIVELVFAFLTFLMQLCGLLEHNKFAYFTLGFYLTTLVVETIDLIDQELFSLVAIGYWLGVGLSLLALILVFVSGFLPNIKKVKRVPIKYDAKTGEPIYE